MKIDDWLRSATQTLSKAGIQTARLDSLVLLESVLTQDRSWIIANPQEEISKSKLNKLDKLISQRSSHIPIAYITHKAYFYNNAFYIDDQVLIPRSESEKIIDILKTLPKTHLSTIIDIGTGSGILAITAKLLCPTSRVVALDIDPECLKIAKKNSLSMNADIMLLKSDLLESLPTNLANNSIFLVNLPYVADSFNINAEARFEPKTAIFGGSKGLDLYSRLFNQIITLKAKPSYVITESFPDQQLDIQSMAARAGYQCLAVDDFIQLFSRLP